MCKIFIDGFAMKYFHKFLKIFNCIIMTKQAILATRYVFKKQILGISLNLEACYA